MIVSAVFMTSHTAGLIYFLLGEKVLHIEMNNTLEKLHE